MSRSEWSKRESIKESMKVTGSGLATVLSSLSAINITAADLRLTFPDGETRKLRAPDALLSLTDSDLERASALAVYGHSDEGSIDIDFNRNSYSGTVVSLHSSRKADLIFLSGFVADMKVHLASENAGRGLITSEPRQVAVLTPGPDKLALTDAAPPTTGISKIRKVPAKLPDAKLFIDDLEEIAEILKSVARSERTPRPQIKLSTDTEEFVDFDAMLNRGGSSRYLRMEVLNRSLSIRFYSILQPELDLVGVAEPNGWATYSRIKSIFDSRAYTCKNALSSLDPWSKKSLWVVWIALPYLLGHLEHRLARGALLVYIVLSMLTAFAYYRPSVVVFRRSHTQRQWINDRTFNYLQNLLFTVLGAALSVLLQAVYDHVTKR